MKVELYAHKSRVQQNNEILAKIREEWVARNGDNRVHQMPMPPQQVLDERRPDFPLKKFEGHGTVLGWATEGDSSEVYPVGIILRDNGDIESWPVNQIEVNVDATV